MLRSTLLTLLAVLVVVFVTVACGESTETTSQDFGCCPPAKPICAFISSNGGKKRSADDDCRAGNDGTIADADQPGWTMGTDHEGCAAWFPPKNPITIPCGLDAGVDAKAGADGDASDADASDAPDDASDASDAPTD